MHVRSRVHIVFIKENVIEKSTVREGRKRGEISESDY